MSPHPLLSDSTIQEPRSQTVGGRSHPPLTGLSHPVDTETGEAEEHDRDERHQQVDLLGPHGAGGVRVWQRWRWGAGVTPPRTKKHASACAPGRAPLRTLPTASVGPRHTRPLGAPLPKRTLHPSPPEYGSALRIRRL